MSNHENVHPEPKNVQTPPADPPAKKETKQLRVTASALNIRKDPDLKAPVVVSVPKGTMLSMTEKHKDFYGVSTADGHKGYVMGTFVEEV